MALLLGVDAGGTRSTAWLVDEAGGVCGRADGGPANYQCVGADGARDALSVLVNRALDDAGAEAAHISWAGYGIAGADRPKDFEAVQNLLPASPDRAHRRLVNDSHLALRAGTPDGVGVGIVSGTGTNAIGCAADGTMAHVGGYGFELGDFGSASDLGREAIRAAMRGREGRGRPTALYDRLCRTLGVDPLEDVIDRWMDGPDNTADLGQLAPLVFEEAAAGDDVASALLRQVGRELALSARLLIDKLFPTQDPVAVVLGGSVLQRGRKTDATVVQTMAQELRSARPGVELSCLIVEPVVGAVLLAHDLTGHGSGRACPFQAGLRESVGGHFAEDVTSD